jgi:Phage tail repeat like
MSRINSLSVTPGLVPTPNKLEIAQIAINAADGKLFIKLTSGIVICVGQDITKFALSDELDAAIESIDLTPYALQATVTQALTGVAQQLATLSQVLSGKAASIHGHAIADVAELGTTLSTMQQGINGKQPAGDYAAAAHNHSMSEVTSLGLTLAQIQTAINGKQPAGNYQPTGNYAAAAHNHGFGEIPGLSQVLDGKAAIGGVSGAWSCNSLTVASAIIGGSYIAAGVGYSFRIGADTVARPPNRNGWQNPTGPIATGAFNTQSVTLPELAKRLGAVIQELRYHGLLSQYGATL